MLAAGLLFGLGASSFFKPSVPKPQTRNFKPHVHPKPEPLQYFLATRFL